MPRGTLSTGDVMRFRRIVFDMSEYESYVFRSTSEESACLIEKDYCPGESTVRVIKQEPTLETSDAIVLFAKDGLARILALPADSIKNERLRQLIAIAQYATEQISNMLSGGGSNS